MKIAILSRGPQLYSTQSLLRAGIRRGHYVRIIDHGKCNLTLENGIAQIIYNGELLESFDAIIPRIGASATQQGAAVIRHFEIIGTFTVTSSAALVQARDKLHALQKLVTHRIDSPKTVLVTSPGGVLQVLGHLGGFPIVIKLLESTHGVGVLLAETPHRAISIIEAFQKLKERVIVQEYIEESGGADIRVIVVGGEILAAMKRQAKAGEFRSNLHRGASASTVKLDQKEAQIVIKAVEIMGLDVAGVDLLRSKRGPLVLEVNASPGLEGIETVTGIDIAGKVIKWVEKNTAPNS